MSFIPKAIAPIPERTASVAHKAFPKGTTIIHLRDSLDSPYLDEDFKDLFGRRGQPGWSAWRLAMITVMQYIGDLTDRQAADAVRGRIDWKYALSLELEDSGIDASVLSEFRDSISIGGQGATIARQVTSSLSGKRLDQIPRKTTHRFNSR